MIVSSDVADEAMSADAAMNAMVSRVSAEVGLDPATIIALFTAIMTMIKNCKNPQKAADVQALLDDVAENHPDRAPFWMMPKMRQVFRDHGHNPRLNVIHGTWAAIADDAVNHPAQATAVMLAA